MNFKTTIALIICLIAVGVTVWLTRNQTNEPPPAAATVKYIDMPAEDVRKLVITPASDPPITLEKRDTVWRMTTPVDAPADFDAADGLVHAISDLESKGKVDVSGKDAEVMGLDQPNFKIEITDKNGKSVKLAVGNQSGVGDNLYIRKEGDDKPDMVAAGLYQQLNKPASGFRDLKMVDAKTTDIRSLEITRPGAEPLSLKKVGNDWQIAAGPTTMPADETAVSDLLFAVTGLKANEFVAEKSDDLKRYGLADPSITISYNVVPQPAIPTTAPTTQTSTQPGQIATVKFGRPVDLRKQEFFAMGASSAAIAKVPSSTTQPFDKTALDLRDKKVLMLAPTAVETISIQTNKPATTQPTSRPTFSATITIARNHTVPSAPWHAPLALPPGQKNPTTVASTQSTTQPATLPTTVATTAPATAPSTAPSAPPAKWQITSAPLRDADESTVDGLVTMLNPLHAEKFLAKSPAPTTQPTDQYTITITTAGATPATYSIGITDPGGTANPVAHYGDLTFEVTRGLIDKLTGKFEASAHLTPATPPGGPAGSGPGSELLSPGAGAPTP